MRLFASIALVELSILILIVSSVKLALSISRTRILKALQIFI
jgi:hypothetical protein